MCARGEGGRGGCSCAWERGGRGESDWMTFNFPPSPVMLDFLLECFVGPTREAGFLPIHLHREVTVGARAAGNGAVRISSCVRSRLCAGLAMARGARWAQSGLQRLSIPAPDVRRRGRPQRGRSRSPACAVVGRGCSRARTSHPHRLLGVRTSLGSLCNLSWLYLPRP